jgi:hypothetical protein
MIQLNSLSSNILNTAGDLSKSNAATTMLTTGLGVVRAGMVPLDKKTPAEEKSQVMTWMLAATALSLVTQMTVYKALNGIVNGINIKNLKLGQHANEYKNLQKLPLDNIEAALKGSTTNSNHWKAVKKAVITSFDLKNPKEREVAKTLLQNLNNLAQKTVGSTREVPKENIEQILRNVKGMQGSKQFFMFLFGAALFTGYVIPTFITKYLPNMLNFLHDKLKINGKPVVPKPKEGDSNKKKKTNFKLFGIPLLASGGALAFLRYHNLNMDKGIGKVIHKGFKKIAFWDHGLSPNSRIVRNIMTNAILRPAAALLDGRLFLAAYNFVIELLSAGSLMGSKKVLGSANNKNGLVGKAIKKLNITDIKKMKGLEFIMTHSIQTFLILGVILGLTTNVVSRHLTNFLKKHSNLNEENNPVPKTAYFPATVKLKNDRGYIQSWDHKFLSPQFMDFLSKTGHINQQPQSNINTNNWHLNQDQSHQFFK